MDLNNRELLISLIANEISLTLHGNEILKNHLYEILVNEYKKYSDEDLLKLENILFK